MGRIRKAMSVGTLGVVRWSNGAERAAKEARRTRRLTAQQLAEQRAAIAAQQQPQVVYVPVPQPPVMPAQQPQQWQQQQPTAQQPIPQRPVAGWYVDPGNAALLRWWDGMQWTGATQARPY